MSQTTPLSSVLPGGVPLRQMTRPPYDPLFLTDIEKIESMLPRELDLEKVRVFGDGSTADSLLQKFPDFEHVEYAIPGGEGDESTITLSVFKQKASTSTKRHALYSVHSGGQIAGNRFVDISRLIPYFHGIDVVIITVEYRLAPEHKAPAALQDAYAGLVWTAEHASDLGIDPGKIILEGCSGGGPIAAACAMLCRDSNKPYPLAQMLLTPMLDDRDCTVSAKQFAHGGPWSGTMNRMAWELVLGAGRGGPEVSPYHAPARATNLEGVAPAFIDVGACEVFRDEAIGYASQLWKCGVSAEIHVWPGAYHGFDALSPPAPVTEAALDVKVNWVRRVYGL